MLVIIQYFEYVFINLSWLIILWSKENNVYYLNKWFYSNLISNAVFLVCMQYTVMIYNYYRLIEVSVEVMMPKNVTKIIYFLQEWETCIRVCYIEDYVCFTLITLFFLQMWIIVFFCYVRVCVCDEYVYDVFIFWF